MADTKPSWPTIRLKTTIVHRVHYNDLNEFIYLITGGVMDGKMNFNCSFNEDWDNPSQHTFSVNGVLNEYDRKVWDNFTKQGIVVPYMVSIILNGMCSRNLIPRGTYLIDASW